MLRTSKNFCGKIQQNTIDNVCGIPYNRYITKVINQNTNKGSKLSNTLTVGSQFTTAKSGVSGTIQEVIANKTGSFRVRLDVNGQPRWTTVK